MIWSQGSSALRILAEEENPTKETKRSGQRSRKETVVVQSCLTLYESAPWAAASQASLSLPISQSLPKFMSIESVMPSNLLILCHPLLLLPSIFPSIRVFSNELAVCIRLSNYWSFSFTISPSKEYSGLISFNIDLFDLLAFQGTFKCLLQHHSLKVLEGN